MNPAYQLFQTHAQDDLQLYTLLRFASKCDHVTALTMNSWESTSTFLTAQAKTIRIYNLSAVDPDVTNKLVAASKEIDVDFSIGPNLGEIEDTDLLYINTPSEGNYRAMELGKYAQNVRKYIVLPNTVVHAHRASDNIKLAEGVKPIGMIFGINHFLQTNDNWFILEHDEVAPGITVLVNKDNVVC